MIEAPTDEGKEGNYFRTKGKATKEEFEDKRKWDSSSRMRH